MANRPTFIDLRSKSHTPMGTAMPSPRGSPRPLPSPRLHVAGEIPPDLSPLDAFAAQSRLLARQLEESMSEGKRMSRLPPLTIENHLAQRPTYLRSVSADPVPVKVYSELNEGSGQNAEVENPGFRPVSVHPQLSGVAGPPVFGFQKTAPTPTSRLGPTNEDDEEESFRGRRPPSGHGHDFGARKEESPAPVVESQRADNALGIQERPSMESFRQRGPGQKRPPDVSLGFSGYNSRALAPPRSPFAQRTPSPRSIVSTESSDDDLKNSREGAFLDRSFSGGSGFSQSPPLASPTAHFMARSPSISSEISVGGTRLPRPAFNFSRPLSRASMNGVPVDMPSRQASSDSQPSFILADDTAHTPVSMHSEGFPDIEGGAAPSYTYSRFALPRGKMLQRNSMIFQDSPSSQWDQSTSSNLSYNGTAPPSPPSRPSTSYKRSIEHSRPSLDRGRPSTSHHPQDRPSLDPGRPSYDPSFDFGPPTLHPSRRPSYETREGSLEAGRLSTEHQNALARPSSPSAASSSTIKARSSLAPSSESSAEEHVAKAIEYHEAGALTKSTYHLRLAARQQHPTGMLLYALACRHGWGMRPNQKEGVQWLRRAVDCAGLEVADDEDLIKDGKSVDFLERKARKAQFALSVYELGVSHMNGWGIEQDKVLALRCFEIAGSWGDADALAEAGFCYAQGMGCKKDLKKSASLYRQAEAKGISMVGNSWIYKAKYAEDPKGKEAKVRPDMKRAETARSEIEGVREEVSQKKKPRDKSRTRTIFGRIKKS